MVTIYEVFVCVPYFDPDWNTCYDRKNGALFSNKEDAKAYLDKMFNDEEANLKLDPDCYDGFERRYVSLSDYVETGVSWNDFCRFDVQEKMSEEEKNRLRKIFKTNFLVDDMKWNDAILLAVTYGGNRWFLRETELN